MFKSLLALSTAGILGRRLRAIAFNPAGSWVVRISSYYEKIC